MKQILFIANIADPEVKMINLLYDELLKRDLELVLLLFKTHNSKLLELKPKKFVFNHSLPTKMYFFSSDEQNVSYDYKKYFSIDKSLCEGIDKKVYKISLSRFNNDFLNIINTLKIDSVILNHHLDGVFEFIKDVLNNKKISYIEYMRWSFTGYYKFSNNLFDRNTEIHKEKNQHVKFPAMSFKYATSKNSFKSKKPFILFLGGGYELGAQVKASPFFKTRGYSWGSEENIIKKISDLWCEEEFEYNLVVRQHPFNIFKINFENFKSEKFIFNGADYDLAQLISDAKVVISCHTTLVEHLLLANKKVLFLGNHEFCNYCLTCVKDMQTLKEKLKNIDSIEIDDDKIQNTLSSYYNQYVLDLDNKKTIENTINRIVDNEPFKNSQSNKKNFSLLFQFKAKTNILKNILLYYLSVPHQKIKGFIKSQV